MSLRYIPFPRFSRVKIVSLNSRLDHVISGYFQGEVLPKFSLKVHRFVVLARRLDQPFEGESLRVLHTLL